MSTNLLSCCPFPQITFSFPLNIFHFLANFCTVFTQMCMVDLCFTITMFFALFPISSPIIQLFFFSFSLSFLLGIFFWGGRGGGQRRGQLLSIELLFPQNNLSPGAWARACREKEGHEGNCLGWDTWIRHADCQGAREGTSGQAGCQVMNLDGKEVPLEQKMQVTELGTQVTQSGYWEQPALLSFLSTFLCLFFQQFLFSSPILYPKQAKAVWQSTGDGGLVGRANGFLCFVQMYKQTITYSHYPVIIHHTDQFYFPCTKYVTGTVFVTNCTIGYAGLL